VLGVVCWLSVVVAGSWVSGVGCRVLVVSSWLLGVAVNFDCRCQHGLSMY
jgi:hypothetical protein